MRSVLFSILLGVAVILAETWVLWNQPWSYGELSWFDSFVELEEIFTSLPPFCFLL